MYYTYRQSNPGGSFIQDDRVGQYVIIEADNPRDANRHAERIGIYFNGVDEGRDCSCCGDRWYPAGDFSDKGTEQPTIYDEPIDKFVESQLFSPLEKIMTVHIYRKDGGHEKLEFDMAKKVKENKAKDRAQADKLWAISVSAYGLYRGTMSDRRKQTDFSPYDLDAVAKRMRITPQANVTRTPPADPYSVGATTVVTSRHSARKPTPRTGE